MSRSMSGPRRQALRDLWRRYRDVFRAAWAERHATTPPDRQAHEAAFLPAHLELMETPLHPLPRWTMRVLVALVLLTLLISVFGKLDIVVVANGTLMPDSNVKIIQPAITGVVRAIHVHDGERVQTGQPLIELDIQQAAADAGHRARRSPACGVGTRSHAGASAGCRHRAFTCTGPCP